MAFLNRLEVGESLKIIYIKFDRVITPLFPTSKVASGATEASLRRPTPQIDYWFRYDKQFAKLDRAKMQLF
jgi:hypothetical protein